LLLLLLLLLLVVIAAWSTAASTAMPASIAPVMKTAAAFGTTIAAVTAVTAVVAVTALESLVLLLSIVLAAGSSAELLIEAAAGLFGCSAARRVRAVHVLLRGRRFVRTTSFAFVGPSRCELRWAARRLGGPATLGRLERGLRRRWRLGARCGDLLVGAASAGAGLPSTSRACRGSALAVVARRRNGWRFWLTRRRGRAARRLGLVAIGIVAGVRAGTVGRTSTTAATGWASTFAHAVLGER
jgi:hypothetical protein